MYFHNFALKISLIYIWIYVYQLITSLLYQWKFKKIATLKRNYKATLKKEKYFENRQNDRDLILKMKLP